MIEEKRSLWSRVVDALELRQYLRPRDFAIAALMVSLVMPLMLVSPRPGAGTNRFWRFYTIELGGPVHIVKNVDSWEFEHDAANPGDLLTFAHRHWQSRPLAIWIAWLLSQPFRAAGMPSPAAMTQQEGQVLMTKPPYPSEYWAYSPQYAGFILMNWLLLVGSVVLLKPLLRATSFLEPRALLPVSLLIANIVTKAFFWTPHTQIFSVILPVGTMTLIRALLPRVSTLRLRNAVAIGIASGILALAYGAFAITAGTAVLAILFGNGWRSLRNDLQRRSVLSAALLIAFFGPFLLWLGFVMSQTGTFYSAEVQRYQEFIWIYQRIPDGLAVYLPLVAKNIRTYAEFALHAAMIPALLIAGLVIFCFDKTARFSLDHTFDDTRKAVTFFIVADAVFYMWMGFYAERLAWTIVPAVLVVLGLELGSVDAAISGWRRLFFRIAVGLVAVGSAYHVIFRPGPYS